MIAIASSAVLLASGLVAPSAMADDDKQENSEVIENITERPDGVSAQITAKATGHRVEDLSLRTATEQVFANPDGTWTSEATAAARFTEEDGSFVPLGEDQELTDTKSPVIGAGTELSIADGKESVGDGPTSDSVILAELESTAEHEGAKLSLGWEGELPTPEISDNQATYSDQVVVPVEGEDAEGEVTPQTSAVTPFPSDPVPTGSTDTEQPVGQQEENAPESSSAPSDQVEATEPSDPEAAPSEEPGTSGEPTKESAEPTEESAEPTAESAEPTAEVSAEVQSVGASVVVEPLRSGFSHRTLLAQAPEGEVSLRFPVKLSKGLKLVKDEETGDLRAVNAKKETVFFAPAPTMWDAKSMKLQGFRRLNAS